MLKTVKKRQPLTDETIEEIKQIYSDIKDKEVVSLAVVAVYRGGDVYAHYEANINQELLAFGLSDIGLSIIQDIASKQKVH